jgi:hypothetical protein
VQRPVAAGDEHNKPRRPVQMDVDADATPMTQALRTIFYSWSVPGTKGCDAWQMVLNAVATGKMSADKGFNGITRLLHAAAGGWSVVYVQQLLKLGASPSPANYMGATPMHLAAGSGLDTVAKCKLLPRSDLSACDKQLNTPLHSVIGSLRVDQRNAKELLDALQWMVEQPECSLDSKNCHGYSALDMLVLFPEYAFRECAAARAVLRTAMAQQARRSQLRTTWIATVAAASG